MLQEIVHAEGVYLVCLTRVSSCSTLFLWLVLGVKVTFSYHTFVLFDRSLEISLLDGNVKSADIVLKALLGRETDFSMP